MRSVLGFIEHFALIVIIFSVNKNRCCSPLFTEIVEANLGKYFVVHESALWTKKTLWKKCLHNSQWNLNFKKYSKCVSVVCVQSCVTSTNDDTVVDGISYFVLQVNLWCYIESRSLELGVFAFKEAVDSVRRFWNIREIVRFFFVVCSLFLIDLRVLNDAFLHTFGQMSSSFLSAAATKLENKNICNTIGWEIK